MSASKPSQPDQPDDATPESKPAIEKNSGRVAFDARGNAVWEWSMATGKFGADPGRHCVWVIICLCRRHCSDAHQQSDRANCGSHFRLHMKMSGT